MRLIIGFKMKVIAQKPDEEEQADRMNAEIAELGLNRMGGQHWRRPKFDDSLAKDFTRLLSDMKQLFDRADARRSRRQ